VGTVIYAVGWTQQLLVADYSDRCHAAVIQGATDVAGIFDNLPGITADDTKNIKTEVYRLPGAGFAEKDGTFVNSARWLQWKWAAVPPPGDARLDQEISAQIFLKVLNLYIKRGRQGSRFDSQSELALCGSEESIVV
jgi:anaerobic selenocysteine-containing dehydrogenase